MGYAHPIVCSVACDSEPVQGPVHGLQRRRDPRLPPYAERGCPRATRVLPWDECERRRASPHPAGNAIPDGGVYRVDYVGSSAFGAPARSRKPVVTALRTAGQNVSPNATYYWYSGPASGRLWYNPAKVEDRGFAESWAQDGPRERSAISSGVFASHAHVRAAGHGHDRDAHRSRARDTGHALGSGRAALDHRILARQSVTYGVKRLDLGAGSGCLSASEPGATDYPLRVIQTRSDAVSVFGATEAVVRNDTACTDVDLYGNVLATTTSELLGGTAGPSLVTRQSFTGSTACKNVPLELRVTRIRWAPSSWPRRSRPSMSPVGSGPSIPRRLGRSYDF